MANVSGPRAKLDGADKHDAEVRAIRRAAYTVMGRSESGTTSVQDILAEAGLSTRAFYRHFASKDDLIIAMYRTDAERVTEQLAAAVGAAGTSTEALLAWIEHWLAIAYDQRRAGHIRVLGSLEAQSARGFRVAHHDSQESARRILAKILAGGRATGDFPLSDPVPDSRMLYAMVQSLVDARTNREPAPTWAEARAQLRHLAERTLGVTLP